MICETVDCSASIFPYYEPEDSTEVDSDNRNHLDNLVFEDNTNVQDGIHH